ncbi:MAG: hypothetical protein IPM95_00155 [Sphingobacteriales bacterium]|nr:hypothetical protein [Sphingobacteriales bacterium]
MQLNSVSGYNYATSPTPIYNILEIPRTIMRHVGPINNQNWGELFLGSATINISQEGTEYLRLTISNETSRNSLNAHMGPNYDRNVAGNVPLSIISQTIQILVPIDYSRLPNYQNKPAYFKQGN